MCYWYFSKYAWVIPLKDKKGVSIVNAFEKILKESDRKPTKIWVDKIDEFCNSSLKKWLKDNDVEMYLIHNEGKSVAAERFLRTLKTKIYKHLTAISKNVYIDKLDDIVNEYYTKTKENEKKYKTCKSLFEILKEKFKKIYYSRKFKKM